MYIYNKHVILNKKEVKYASDFDILFIHAGRIATWDICCCFSKMSIGPEGQISSCPLTYNGALYVIHTVVHK